MRQGPGLRCRKKNSFQILILVSSWKEDSPHEDLHDVKIFCKRMIPVPQFRLTIGAWVVWVSGLWMVQRQTFGFPALSMGEAMAPAGADEEICARTRQMAPVGVQWQRSRVHDFFPSFKLDLFPSGIRVRHQTSSLEVELHFRQHLDSLFR